jgi:subtilisin family serine protease
MPTRRSRDCSRAARYRSRSRSRRRIAQPLIVHLTLEDPPFAGRSGRGVVVAVLDSGIHAEHPHIGGVGGGVSFIDDSDDFVDRIGHGTAVAAAIHEKAPAANLLAVRIFDRHLATNADVLARAIEWAAERGAHLINLSLGTANAAHAERLAAAAEYAKARGALIISAIEANGVSLFPGSLPSVAGVAADWTCERDALVVEQRPNGVSRFAGSAYPRPIPGVPKERNLAGVSFAVANVSGFLARAIEAGSIAALMHGGPLAD